MLSQSIKLVAVRSQQEGLSPALQQLEELYIYGVLVQMARFAEVQYRDLATLPESTQPELTVINAKLSPEAVLAQCRGICLSTRNEALFLGAVEPTGSNGPHPTELKVSFRLVKADSDQYLVNEVVRVLSYPGLPADENTLPISLDDLNRLINQTVLQFLRALFGEASFPAVEWAPLSHSLKAIQALLKAHKTSVSLEKIALYEAALRDDPALETAHTHLARLYRNEAEYEKSIVSSREVLKISSSPPRNKAIYATEGGISCALLGKTDLALQWWMRAIEYDPHYINPYFNIANVYEDQGNFEMAEKYFLQAQQLAPEDFRTFFNLARIYSKLGNWDKALMQYRYQLRTEGEDPWCHSDVATCYLNLGDLANARQHLERTVTLDPDGEAGQYAQLILGGLLA